MAEWKKGKLNVNKSKKGKFYGTLTFIDESGKTKTINSLPNFDFKQEMKDKEIEFQIENGQVIKIRIDGNELPSKWQQRQQPVSSSSNTQKGRDRGSVSPQSQTREDYIIRNSSCNLKCPLDTKLLMDKIDNFSLGLQKFIMFDKNNKPVKFVELDKMGLVNSGESQIPNTAVKIGLPDGLINSILTRYKEIKDVMKKNGFEVSSFECRPEWRFVVGLGSESIYEVSMTLHHIYGFPYIPGSAVKGIIRSWVINTEFDQNEKEALEDEIFVNIFGDQKNRGKVVFMDAFPRESPTIEVDIMNPHYSEYYSGEKPPADYLSPVPVQFLTVTNTKFEFNLMSKDKEMLDKAKVWLKDALMTHGIGAKTAVGYGYFVELCS